jgi:hypothetical protein
MPAVGRQRRSDTEDGDHRASQRGPDDLRRLHLNSVQRDGVVHLIWSDEASDHCVSGGHRQRLHDAEADR